VINLLPFTRFALTLAQKAKLCDAILAREYMQRVDFEHIKRTLDEMELRHREKLREVLLDVQDALLRQVQSQFDARTTPQSWISGLKLRKFAAVRQALRAMLVEATLAGQRHAGVEIPRVRYMDSRITISPKAAVKAAQDKAFYVSGILDSRLVQAAQAVLVQAIKAGETLMETMRKLEEAWLPWLGDPSIIEDAEQLKPHRLETIVRTNTTDAYNVGRLAQMRDPDLDPYLLGVRYSAILDERTTDICRDLHGKVFRKDDPDLDALVPPNHFNCRSILVPVLIDEKVPTKDFATARDVGIALDRMSPDFGGAAAFTEEEIAEIERSFAASVAQEEA
jgi:SPP1 gp7 family putative phage head morphogenesis protein